MICSKDTDKLVILVKVSNPLHMNVPPLGILYIGDALKKAGYKVKVFHISDNEIQKYGRIIIKDNPIFVGISVITGASIRVAVNLSRTIKKSSNIPVVWGNVHPSVLPEQCLREDYIDFVVIGEGEETCVELACAIENKESFTSIKGIGFKDNNGLVKTNERRSFIKDLDKYEIDWELVNIEKYIVPHMGIQRTLRLVLSRGCPYGCTFCYNQAVNYRRWRTHSVDYSIDLLSRLAGRYNLEGIFFNDDNFFVNQKWSWKILEKINIPYSVELRAEYVDEEFAKKLVSTNCGEVLFGYESGSERVLKEVVNKGSTVQDHRRATKILSKYPQIKIAGSFIVAFPGETKDEYRRTVSFMCELLDITPNISYTVGFFLPFPGTELFKIALKKGFSPPTKTEDWDAMDRWSDRLRLTWVDWISSEKSANLRQAMMVLTTLYKFNIAIAKQLVRKMVLNEDYSNLLIILLNKVRIQYSYGDRSKWHSRIIRVSGNLLKKLKGVS